MGTIVLIFLIVYFFIQTSEQTQTDTAANTPVATSTSAIPATPPRFSAYATPPSEIFTGTPAPVALESNAIGKTFPTRLTEGASKGPNFAGHYTVVEWGCGTMCSQFAIVDAQSGEIFAFSSSTLAGLSYNIDSNLLVINPPSQVAALYPDATQIPQYITSSFYEWRSGDLHLLVTYAYENGTLKEVATPNLESATRNASTTR